MTNFDDIFGSVAAPVVFEQFAEEVTYRPSGGTPRTIKAIVDREAPDDAIGGALQARATIEVFDATTSTTTDTDNSAGGIGVDEFNRGKDQIVYPLHRGGTTTRTGVITDLVRQGGGKLAFVVR